METQRYMRRPFYVDAVLVTYENFEEVRLWCGGEAKKTRPQMKPNGNVGLISYIRVDARRPLNPKQTMAFVGDWILKTDTGFKVFTDKAFHNTFVNVTPTPLVNLGGLQADDREEWQRRQDPDVNDRIRTFAEMTKGRRSVSKLPNGARVFVSDEGVQSIGWEPAEDMTVTKLSIPLDEVELPIYQDAIENALGDSPTVNLGNIE